MSGPPVSSMDIRTFRLDQEVADSGRVVSRRRFIAVAGAVVITASTSPRVTLGQARRLDQ